MNSTIQAWINKINNGSEVFLNDFAELFKFFPDIDYQVKLPVEFLSAKKYQITNIEVTQGEHQSTVAEINFSIDILKSWNIVAGSYEVSASSIELTISNIDTEDIYLDSIIEGEVLEKESKVSLPFVFRSDYSEDEEFFSDEENSWKLECQLSDTLNEEISFADLEKFLKLNDLDKAIPAIYKPTADLKLKELTIVYRGADDTFSLASYLISLSRVELVNALSMSIENAALRNTVHLPFDPEESSTAIQGAFKFGDLTLPIVEISIPSDEESLLNIEMINSEYALSDINILNSLFDGFNLANSLPQALQKTLEVKLTRFSCLFDLDTNGFEELSLSIKLNEGSNWSLVSDKLYLSDISFDFNFAPAEIVLRGITHFGSVAVPIKAAYEIPDESDFPSYLSLELDTGNQYKSVPINISDFSFLGVEPLANIPGLSDLTLDMNELSFEFEISDTIQLTNFNFEVSSDNYFKILPKFKIGEFGFEFQYQKSLDDEPDFYEGIIDGVLDLDLNGVDPLPVSLTIPSEGDWNLEVAGEDSDGVALPGLPALKELVGVDFSSILPSFIKFEAVNLVEFSLDFPHPREGKINSAYFDIFTNDFISFNQDYGIKDVRLQLEADYMQTDATYAGSLSATFRMFGVDIPVLLPLPVNSQEYTIQLAEPVEVPSFELINKYTTFGIETLLKKIPGFSTPELSIGICNLKFNLDPFELQIVELGLEFTDSIKAGLKPAFEFGLNTAYLYRDFKKDKTITAAKGFLSAGSFLENIPLSLELTDKKNTLTIDMPEGEPLKFSLGSAIGLIPGVTCPKPMENCSADVTEMNVTYDENMQLQEYGVSMHASGIGDSLGTGIVNDKVKFQADYDKDGRPGLQFLEWPFKKPNIETLEKKGWVLLDFGSAGAIKLKMPKIQTDGANLVLGAGFDNAA